MLHRFVPMIAITACWSAKAAPSPQPQPHAIATSPTTIKPAAGLLERVPFQVWPRLGAQTVGLLVVNQSDLGPVLLWTRYLRAPNKAEGPGDPCYLFFTDGKSANALYFPSKGDGVNFMSSWTVPLDDGKHTAPMGVAMMCPKIANPYGLTANAHLVRLEVNAGAGAPPNIHFIATRVEVLDGTPAYPLVPARTLAEGRARFDQFVADLLRARGRTVLARPMVEPALSPGRHPDAEVPGFGAAVESIQEGLFPTWDDRKQQLSALFIRRISRTRTRGYWASVSQRCPPGAPCMPPQREWVEDQLVASVDAGYSVVWDRNGKLISEEFFDSIGDKPGGAIAR